MEYLAGGNPSLLVSDCVPISASKIGVSLTRAARLEARKRSAVFVPFKARGSVWLPVVGNYHGTLWSSCKAVIVMN